MDILLHVHCDVLKDMFLEDMKLADLMLDWAENLGQRFGIQRRAVGGHARDATRPPDRANRPPPPNVPPSEPLGGYSNNRDRPDRWGRHWSIFYTWSSSAVNRSPTHPPSGWQISLSEKRFALPVLLASSCCGKSVTPAKAGVPCHESGFSAQENGFPLSREWQKPVSATGTS